MQNDASRRIAGMTGSTQLRRGQREGGGLAKSANSVPVGMAHGPDPDSRWAEFGAGAILAVRARVLGRGFAGCAGCWPQPFGQAGAADHPGPLPAAPNRERRQQCCPFLQHFMLQSGSLFRSRGARPYRYGVSSAKVRIPATTLPAPRISPRTRAVTRTAMALLVAEMVVASFTGVGCYGRRRISIAPFSSQAASTPPPGSAESAGKAPAPESWSTLPSIQDSSFVPFTHNA